MVHHQDSVGHWIASPHVTVITFRQQGRDAHHLSGLLRFLDPVLPRRQLGAEDDGSHHEDGGQHSQAGDGDEGLGHQSPG